MAKIDLFILQRFKARLGTSILRVKMLLAKLSPMKLFNLEHQSISIKCVSPEATSRAMVSYVSLSLRSTKREGDIEPAYIPLSLMFTSSR